VEKVGLSDKVRIVVRVTVRTRVWVRVRVRVPFFFFIPPNRNPNPNPDTNPKHMCYWMFEVTYNTTCCLLNGMLLKEQVMILAYTEI
jgi:transglutaminase-like putative cysteine protease